MHYSMPIARARTFLSEVLWPFDHVGERAWSAVRPKLQLSHDMASVRRRERFARNILRAGLSRPTRYLEIGSFEGGSLAFVHSLLDGQITATSIDPFQDYDEMPVHMTRGAEQRFRANMRAVGIDVRVLRGPSVDRLPPLVSAGETFDLIFIDGSHTALDVMTDAVLCWRLLSAGGLMIFDDYRDFECRPAIDAFVRLVNARVVSAASQVFLHKRTTA
jgi:precorrin-6B methylase 2